MGDAYSQLEVEGPSTSDFRRCRAGALEHVVGKESREKSLLVGDCRFHTRWKYSCFSWRLPLSKLLAIVVYVDAFIVNNP